MAERKNCWEVRKCGLEPGGENVSTSGICPAAEPQKYQGYNRGQYFGRSCWMVPMTLCDNKLQGPYADKFLDCIECEFFIMVEKEEGRYFILTPPTELKW